MIGLFGFLDANFDQITTVHTLTPGGCEGTMSVSGVLIGVLSTFQSFNLHQL